MLKRIERVCERPVFENQFGTFYNDSVRSPSGVQGNYLRWRWSRSGVVIVPRRGDQVALTLAYRYPIDAASLELPRGSYVDNEALEVAAARELFEETGLSPLRCHAVATLFAESGLISNPITVVEAVVSDHQNAPLPDQMESIDPELVWMRRQDIWRSIRAGKITCAITIAALVATPLLME